MPLPKILIVEAAPLLIESYRRKLEDVAQVIGATAAGEAVRAVATHRDLALIAVDAGLEKFVTWLTTGPEPFTGAIIACAFDAERNRLLRQAGATHEAVKGYPVCDLVRALLAPPSAP